MSWVLLLTGMPNAGKSTIAYHLVQKRVRNALIIDGDRYRELQFLNEKVTKKDIMKHTEAVIKIAQYAQEFNTNVIIPQITPFKEQRELMRKELGSFYEVSLSASHEERSTRPNFRDSDFVYEHGGHDIIIETDKHSIEECGNIIIEKVLSKPITQRNKMQGLKLFKVKLQGLIHKFPMLANLNEVEVFIASYPRSGLTWLRCLLAAYIYGDDVWLGNVQEYLPMFGDDLWKPKKINFKIIGSHAEARIVKKLKPNTKIIYLRRSPYSGIDSYHQAFQVRYNVRVTKSFFNKWVNKWYAYPLPYNRFINEWEGLNPYIIDYPFTAKSICDLLDYMGYGTDNYEDYTGQYQKVSEIMDKFEINKMRQMESIISPKNKAVD